MKQRPKVYTLEVYDIIGYRKYKAMNDVKFYEEVLKNLFGSLDTIKDLAAKADDSNWSVVMDQIEATAKQGIRFINTCTDYKKMPGAPDPFDLI